MKTLISILLILALSPYLTGCYSMNQISKTDFEDTSKKMKIELQTKAGDKYQFEYSYFFSGDSLYGSGIKISDGDETAFKGAIALKDILTIYHEEYNITAPILISAFLIVGILFLIMAGSSYHINLFSGHD